MPSKSPISEDRGSSYPRDTRSGPTVLERLALHHRTIVLNSLEPDLYRSLLTPGQFPLAVRVRAPNAVECPAVGPFLERLGLPVGGVRIRAVRDLTHAPANDLVRDGILEPEHHARLASPEEPDDAHDRQAQGRPGSNVRPGYGRFTVAHHKWILAQGAVSPLPLNSARGLKELAASGTASPRRNGCLGLSAPSAESARSWSTGPTTRTWSGRGGPSGLRRTLRSSPSA